MLPPKDIILAYLCPSLGILIANLMFAAPVIDCYKKVKAGKGLQELNPMPWSFMTGNTIGWITYGVLKQNLFFYFSNAPGFVISVWLNLQAVKMQYEHFRSQEMEKSIAAALEQERKKIADPSVEEQDQQTLPVATYAGTPEQPTKSQSFEDTARIVQEVEAKNMVAPARQDTFLMANILLWLAIITLVSYASAFSQTTLELIVGVTVNLNIIVFYGAPLSTIATVLKTRNAVTIHIPTLILNSLNATFWACYGIAIMDPIVIVPNSCGLSLGVVQFVLCVLFPRTELAPAKDDSAKSSTVGDEEAQSDDAAAAAASS